MKALQGSSSVWKHEIVAGLGLTLKPFVGNLLCFKVYECSYV